MNIEIKPSQRWLLMGPTRCGKTEFSKFMLRNISKRMPVFIVDPKCFWLGDNPVWETDKRKLGTIDKPHLVTRYNPKLWVQVIQPIKYDDNLDRSFDAIIKQKYVYVHTDDNLGLCDANSVPDGFRKVCQMGAALHIGFNDCAQTVERIPGIFKSQAENFVVFNMGQVAIEKLKEVSHLVQVTVEELMDLEEYEYILFQRGKMKQGLWMPPLELSEIKKGQSAA